MVWNTYTIYNLRATNELGKGVGVRNGTTISSEISHSGEGMKKAPPFILRRLLIPRIMFLPSPSRNATT